MASVRHQLYTKAKEIALTDGWSRCLQHAARSLDLSPETISHHFPNGNYDVIKSLMEEWNNDLVDYKTRPVQISAKSIIEVGTKRLSKVIPYARHWGEAMKIGAEPLNACNTTRTLWDTFDTILYQSGDIFNPLTHHPRRLTIGGLYVATEAMIARNPENSESCLAYFSAGVHQIDQIERFGNKVCVLATFFGEAGYSMGYSFVAQPTVHANPMPIPEPSLN